ncbi:helicase associated domain-containing protein, partial [Streptomyces sp. NPDC059426]
MVADWVSFNVIDTERQDWARGWAKLKAFTEREGHARVPYEHKEGAFPLGTWVVWPQKHLDRTHPPPDPRR